LLCFGGLSSPAFLGAMLSAFLRVWEKFSLIQTFFWNFAWIRGSFLMLFDVCGLLILV
jgi:hypothetical protein